jgi:pSer/pThr/pTyr-binding forkhead associated (FHA) protein
MLRYTVIWPITLNGNFVNGQRVRRPISLASGDWVQVCKKLLLFVDAKDQRADLGNDDHPNTILV